MWLHALLTTPCQLRHANFNNNEGVGIVVNFDNFNFSAVPEPATFAVLAAMGAFAIVGARRRRGPASD